MKKTVFVLFTFFSTIFYAQNIGIEKSDIIKQEKKNTNLEFSESDGNGGVIVVKSIKKLFNKYAKSYKIEHYNANLQLVKSVSIENKRGFINDILIKDGTINLFQFQSDKKTKALLVNVLSASVEELNFKSNTLFTLDRKMFKKYFKFYLGVFSFDNGMNQEDMDSFGMITFSNEKKYFSLSFDIKNKEKEVHLLVVYDDDFNKIYDTIFESDIDDKFFDFKDITISNEDGTLFLLGKVFENKSTKSKKKKKTNYHYELFEIKDGIKHQTSIKEPEIFIGSLTLLNKNKKLVLVGFYSEKNDNRYKGICRIDLNDDLTIKNKAFQPFSNQFFEDKYRKGAKVRKSKKELHNLEYRSVFYDENDNVIINAEEFYITSYYVSNANGGGYWNTTFNYDDIISVKINPKGELLWARNINKSQYNSATASFSAITANNKNYIFINTSDKINKMSNNRIGFTGTSAKRSNLYVIVIDEKGDFTYKKLIDDKDSKVSYKVSNGLVNIQDNSIIFLGSKKKNQRIIRLTVK